MDCLRTVNGGIELSVWVTPNAGKTSLLGYDNWKKAFKIKAAEIPEKGKANKAILEYFEDLFGKKVCLLSGEKSRSKKLLIPDATLEEIINKLEASASKK